MGRRATVFLLGVVAMSTAAGLTACISAGAPPSHPASSARADPTAATPSTPTPAGAADCQDGFAAAIEPGDDPSTPTDAYVVLTNTGDAACDLSGFPTETAFLGASGPIETVGYGLEGAPTADAFDRAGETVTVEPGGRAYVWARIVRTTDRDGPCQLPVTAVGVTLTLPGATAPITAPLDAEICLDTDADDLQVGPIDSQPRPAGEPQD